MRCQTTRQISIRIHIDPWQKISIPRDRPNASPKEKRGLIPKSFQSFFERVRAIRNIAKRVRKELDWFPDLGLDATVAVLVLVAPEQVLETTHASHRGIVLRNPVS
jgi:hypothetical protein